MSNHKKLEIYIDGSSLGNPGAAGVGIVITEGQHPLKNIARPIGLQTNNVAEYTALIVSLEEALSLDAIEVEIFSDSELMCRQMSGVYKVKNEAIKSLFCQAKDLVKRFKNVRIQQIPRELNAEADKLARQAAKMNGAQPSPA